MPSEEFTDVLHREQAKAVAKDLIAICSPVLLEQVNYATWVYARCFRAPDEDRRGGENEDLAAMILYLQLIELTDSVEVLVSESCANGSIPVVRSAFENSLGLDFLLTSRSHYVQRSLCWVASYIHRRIQKHERLDPRTAVGVVHHDVMKKFLGEIPAQYDSADGVAALRSVLAREQFKEIEADYAARKKKNPGAEPDWFSLLGGPRNRRQLARLLDREAEYLVLYGPWSDVAHGTDAALYLRGTGERGRAATLSLRNPTDLPHLAFMSAAILLRATRMMLQHFRPNEPGLSIWYARDVKPMLDRLRRTRVVAKE